MLQPVLMMGTAVLTIVAYMFSEEEASHDPNSGNGAYGCEGEEAHFRARRTATGTLLRRLSLLPESDSGVPLRYYFHLHKSHHGKSDTSSALVHACFTGLILVHFAVAFWTRTWLFRLVLLFTFIALLAYVIAILQLVPGALWILRKGWVSLNAALRNCDFFNLDENGEYLPPLIIASLKISLRWTRKVERHLYNFVDNYLDYFVSLVIISLMVLVSLLFTVFLVVQVYNETLNLISLSSSVLNSTIHSSALSWLPDRDQLGSAARSAVSNIHQLGRSFISSKVNQLFNGDSENKRDIEEQLLELWEKVCMQFFHEVRPMPSISLSQPNVADHLELYQGVKSKFVLTDDLMGGLNASQAIPFTHLGKRLRNLVHSFGGFDYRDIVAYFHENVGIIMNVVDPMWRILSSHASIITSLLMGTVSLLFTGGSVVLNFSFSFLIFLSTLFYLLAVSKKTYLPVEFVVSLTPQRCEAGPAVLSFYTSVEVAVTSVVVTTLKRTIFYGMYTLLTHTLFGLDVIALPSIIATILGAIPLMGTYWVVLPGVVELWCLRGSYWLALLLLLLHLLPYYFLDTALYSEIKGAGHPYLTGLSIAGGLYYFGTEGVFVGPVALCCMLVGVNLYRLLLTETTEAGRDSSADRPRRIFRKYLFRTPRPQEEYHARVSRAHSEDDGTLT
ncbi:hypothetical protein TcWFU_005901 [Taenia crassiceps]|uniref:Transmembrane protein 245 n=1 Tax=Taenia crassiceps TaxID=6207 RepID=A0ABR4QHK4_9CEST